MTDSIAARPPRRKCYVRAAVAVALVTTGCGPSGSDATGSALERIINGVIPFDNAQGALDFGRAPNSRDQKGSGVLVAPTFALTAAHVVEQNESGIRVTMDDLDSAASTADPIVADTTTITRNDLPHIMHPTYGWTRLQGPQSPVGSLNGVPVAFDVGVDLSVEVLQDAINVQPAGTTLPRPLATQDLQTILGFADGSSPAKQATLYGYGGGDLGSLQASIVDIRPVALRGTFLGQVGSAYIAQPEANRFSQEGDSGGPFAVGGAGEVDLTAGIHRGRDLLTGNMVETALADVHTWVTQLVQSDANVLYAEVNHVGQPGHRPDHIIPLEASGADLIHIEFGEGGRLRYTVARPAGAPSGTFRPFAVGDFLGPARSGGKADSDVVGLIGGRLMVTFNLLQANGPARSELLGTSTYTKVLVRKAQPLDVVRDSRSLRLNADALSDIVAVRSDGGMDFFYATGIAAAGSEFAGPFPSTGTNTCRAADDGVRFPGRGGPTLSNSCGGQAIGGTCSCSRPCANCCPDIDSVCSSTAIDKLLQQLLDLLGQAAISPVGLTNVEAAPIAQIVTPITNGLGTFLDREWIVTSASVVKDLSASQITVTAPGGQALPVASVLVSPEGALALLRATSPAASLPPDHHLDFYRQDDPSIDPTIEYTCYGLSGSTVKGATFPAAAGFMADSGIGEALGLTLIHPPSLFSSAFDVLPGSPVLAPGGSLMGITDTSRQLTVTVAPPGGASTTLTLALHDQLSLLPPNGTLGDTHPSARYWAEQIITRGRLKDANDDGFHDLWATDAALSPVTFGLKGTTALSTAPTAAGPTGALSGNWRFVGRANIAPRTAGLVWHEDDTGEVQIWRMDGASVVDQLSLVVDPSWSLRAVGDVDGDQISDLIWTNDLFDRGFFWLMEGADQFPSLASLSSEPSTLVRSGQWMSPMPLQDGSGETTFDLVAADHFDVGVQDEFVATGQGQGAVDLLWRERGGTTAFVWEMAYMSRACAEITDPVVSAACTGGTTRTYELSQNAVQLDDQPAYWAVVGTGDYNLDGRSDIAWHARGAAAPATDLGHVSIWLSRADGGFDVVAAKDSSGNPIFVDPSSYLLGGG